MSHVRSRARSWVLNLLYGWEIGGEGTPTQHAARAMRHRRMARRYRAYVKRLLEIVETHLDEIDAAIARHASNWRIERLAAIDRNILRIGIAELEWIDDVPPKVAIHEALKLASKYGSDDSARFVNGVLDAVFKGLEEGGREGFDDDGSRPAPSEAESP